MTQNRYRFVYDRPLGTRTVFGVVTFLFVVLTLSPSAFAQSVQSYDLRPKGEAGRTTRYEVWTQRHQTAVVSLAGNSRTSEFTMTSEGELTWTIDKVKPDGSMQCTMTIDWLSLTYADDQGQVHVNDSRKASGDVEPFHVLVKALSGVPVKVDVAPDGSVKGVDGIKGVEAKLKGDFKELMPEELDFVESASDLATLLATPASVEPGDKWGTKVKWTWGDPPFEGFLHHDMTYTFSGVEDMAGVPVAIVDGKSKITLEVDKSELPAEMPPHTVKLSKGDMKLQVMYDLTRGEAVGRNLVQTTRLDISLKLPNATISRKLDETLQSQVLRIAEE